MKSANLIFLDPKPNQMRRVGTLPISSERSGFRRFALRVNVLSIFLKFPYRMNSLRTYLAGAIAVLAVLFSISADAQPWTYDFGTGTGSHTTGASTTFFTGTPTNGGTYRVRVGTGNGSFNLVNPGTSLGSATELQMPAASGTSTNKFGVYSWTSPTLVAYMKANVRTTSTGNGQLFIQMGSSTWPSDNSNATTLTTSSVMIRITYASGAISAVDRYNNGTATAITGSTFLKDTDQLIEIYSNNAAVSNTYYRAGTTYTLTTQQWDLWIGGTKISPANGWPDASTLGNTVNLAGFTFASESSTGNVAVTYVDDLEYSNAFPVAPSGIVSTQNGPWTSGSTWVGGVAPTSTDNVTILHNVTSGAVTRGTGTTTTIGTAGTLVMSGTYTDNGATTVNGVFQLDAGGWATGNNFSYSATTGTLNFNNTSSYGVNSGDVFWPTTNAPFNVNVLQGGLTLNSGANRTVAGTFTTAAGVTLSSATLTCNGTCQINSGGFFNNSPIYGSSSTLVYNNAGAYGSFNEWTGGNSNAVAAGTGVPQNVTIQGSTTLTLAGGRGLAGNLTVSTGAALTLNATSGNDLYVRGNMAFTGTGALNGNNRAVFFVNPGGTQTISSVAALTIPYVVFAPASGATTVQLLAGTALTVSAPNTGNAISFNSASDVLDINGQSLTIGTAGLASTISGAGTFKGSTASTMTIVGTGNVGTLNFTTSFQLLGTLTFNRSSSGAATLGTSLSVTTLALNNGNITLGANNLTVTGTGNNITTTGSFSNTCMIITNSTGQLRRAIPISSFANPYVFPVGTGTNYTPASYTFVNNAFLRNLHVRAVAATHPNMGTIADRIDNRYWVTDLGLSTTGLYTYTASYTYVSGDAVGSTSLIKLNRWNGTGWVNDQGSSIAGTTITSSTLTNTTGSLLATSEWTGRQGLLPEDAGITAISVPTQMCSGSQPVSVTVNNYGTNTITSVTITLTIGGVAQTPFTATGLSIAAGASASVAIGSYTFATSASAVALSASTSLPNGLSDGNTSNDTGTGSAPATGLTGTYTVGASGTYTTITAALAALNTRGMCGPVVLSLIDASYTTGETFPLTINEYSGMGSTNTLTIKPTLANTVITGSVAGAIFQINGADYVTIDGSISATANTICPLVTASRDLTITNNNTTTSAAVVWINTVGTTNPATNNTVKNCNIIGGSSGNTVAGIGIGSSTISSSSLSTGNINNRIENNNIQKAAIGVYTQGASTSNYNTGNVITLNTIAATGTNAVSTWGIFAGFESGIQVTNNTVAEMNATADHAGILLGYGTSITTTSTNGNTVINAVVSGNTVYNIIGTATNSVVGIGISGANGSTTTVTNNVVYAILDNATSPDFSAGIALGGVTGSTFNVYHNSVSMNGTITGGTASSSVSACLAVTTSTTSITPVLDIRNNIFSNSQVGNATATTRFVAIALGYSSTAGNYTNLTSNYNDLYAAGAGPGSYHVGITGGVTGTSRTTLSDWQTQTGRDANSLNVVPAFVSASNLHSTSTNLNNAGTPIVSVTTDIDCESRSATTPDIGADEFSVSTDDAGITAITTSACPGGGNTVTLTVFNFGSATLTSVDVTWSVNGGSSTSQSFTGLSIAGGSSGTVNITGVTFTGSASAQTFTASTSLPNGNADANTSNDSFTNSSIFSALNGTYTVGAAGDFTTIASALSRAASVGVCGPVVFSLIDATYSVTSTLTIGQYSGVSATNTITIKPATGVTAAITGAAAVNPVIIFDGADYVTIDGTNGSTVSGVCPAVTATRDLTITSNSTNSTASAVVWLQTATGSNGATNNRVMNCNIVGNSNTTTLFGVGSGGSTISITTTGTGNNSNSYINNNITKVQHGIYSMGASTANRNTGTVIHKNLMNSASPNNVGLTGILLGFENGANIRGNNISEITSTSNDLCAINVGFTPTTFTSGNTGTNECINTVISDNTIGSVANTGTFSAVGIAHGSSTSGTVLISNNMIYGVRSNATPSDYASGITLGGGTGATFNVYNNSVYMTGTITGGTNFSSTSACLSVTATSAPTLDIRNNIFVNDQVTNGGTSGRFLTIALGYSSTVGNYANLTSNKNGLYVASGTGYHIGTTGGLGSGGTNRTTLANWQTETGRDAASVNVMPVFTSSTNLHLNVASTTNLAFETTADVLASVTTDIDCDTRSATTPDIGVDEFTSTVTPYDIGVSAFVIPSPLCSGSQTVQAVVTNYGALPVTGFDVTWSVNGVPQTTASFPATTVSVAGTVTVTLGTYTFPAGVTPNSITATTVLVADVTTGNDSFTQGSIYTSLSGTYTVGTSGNFTTLTAAVAAANTYGICGPTVFSLIDASYTTSETFPITINALVGSSATNTLTIKPTGTTAITGNNANGILVINGADYVIIDGSSSTTANTVCPLVSASRNLTITNNNTGSTAPVIWIQNATGNGATNNIVRNTNILGAGATNYGIGIGGPALASSGTDNDNNRIENNSVAGVQIGIYSQGASTGNKNTGNVISQNVMTGTSPNIGKWGILVGFEDGIQITANNIANVSGTTGDAAGISLGVTSIIRTYSGGNDVTGATVSGNRIYNITAGSNQSPAGIAISAGAGTANNVINNMISGILYNGTSSSDLGSGFMLYGPSGSTINVYHNNVLLEGTTTSSEALNIGLVTGSNSGSLTRNIRNNIFVTRVSNTGGGKSAGIGNGTGGVVASAFANATMNYNAFGVSGTNSGVVGYSGLSISGFTLFTTLASWQAAGTFDANSVVSNTAFVSSSDLHIDPIDINNLYLNATAVVISGITTDYDCETRNATTPDIGADEYVSPDCTTADGGTATAGTATFCGSGSTTITTTGVTGPYTGITYSWETSANGTTGWTATGSTNPISFTTPTLTTTAYYRLAVSCSISAQTDYSNVVSVTINPYPTAVISPSGSASICSGGSISLSVSTDIGTSFQWYNGASAISGANSSTYSATTAGTYSVEVTGPGACTTTSASVVALVNPVPTPGAAAVTPGTVCANGTVNLTSSATASALYNVTSITHAPLTPTGTPSTIISSGDDVLATTTVTLPFTFNFFGVNKTSLKVSSNGWITFNTGLATSGPNVATLPDGATPGDAVYGIWDDLNVVSGTSLVRYFTNGTSPNRVFVVDYSNVKFYNSTANNGNTSFQILLYETSNIIEVHVTEVTDPVASNKAIGIENTTSTTAYTPVGRNNATFSVSTGSPEAWRFAPDVITYSWSGPNSFTSTLQNPSITNITTAAAGTYTATYTNVFGCTSTATTAALVVNSKPTASISGTTTICDGGSTNLTINVTGTGPFSGTLSNGATFSGAGPTFTVSVSPTTNTTYTVTALSDALCTAQAGDLTGSAVVTVNARPTASISGTTTLCAGSSATLTLTVTGSGTISGTLSDGSTFSGTAPTITVNVTPGGTTTYLITSLSDANCTALGGDMTGSAVVTVNARPTGSIAGSTTLCAGSSATLTLAVSGTGTINGTLSDGTTFTGTAPTITVSVTPTVNTTYTITSLSDANCSALAGGLTGSAVVNVNARPTASISGTTNLCLGSSTNLTLTVTGTGTISGTLSDGTTFSGTAPTITVSVSPTSTITYTVATLNDANCSAISGGLTGSAVVTVNPRPTGAISGTQTMCSNASATLTLTVTGSGTISGTLSDGTSFSGTAPTITVVVTPISNTTYTIATLSDANCTSISADRTGSAVVTVIPAQTYYLDADGDGYSSGTSFTGCNPGVGYYLAGQLIATSGDCNDSNSDIYPTADEYCNGLDEDCDLLIDEGLILFTYYQDNDGDGYGNTSVSVTACTPPAGYVTIAGDCLDTNAAAYPGATEVCNGINDDCDGLLDEGCGPANDNKATAQLLIFNGQNNCNAISGTLFGAQPSTSGTYSTCITGEDVWYYFSPTTTAARIACNTTANNVVMELQTQGGALVEIENAVTAVGNEFLNVDNLTVGATYFIVVRNYDSGSAVGAPFNICVTAINQTGCNYGPGPYSFCGNFKANYTAANQYVFNLTPQPSGTTIIGTSNTTLIPLASIPGIQNGVTYTVRIDAVYNLLNGAGATETIVVEGLAGSMCTLIMGAQPAPPLRTSDACPNIRNRKSTIGLNEWVCGAGGFEWEFTETAPSPGLPMTYTESSPTRFLNLQNVTFLTAGSTYSVRVRPLYNNGSPSVFTTAGCLQLAAPALGALDETDPQFALRNEIENVDAMVYPNPNNGDMVNIHYEGLTDGPVFVRIFDSMGRIVYTNEFVMEGVLNAQITFEKSLTSGIYQIEFSEADRRTIERLVIQK